MCEFSLMLVLALHARTNINESSHMQKNVVKKGDTPYYNLFVKQKKQWSKVMSIADFIITVFCIIDDELKKMLDGKKLRSRGRYPTLTDSEVITMEIVGEFLGKDCDKSIWEYFKNHWLHFFPKLPDRSNFVRQAANLHVIKRSLQERIACTLGSRADSLPFDRWASNASLQICQSIF